MGLKRRNPARSRLLTAPEMLAKLAVSNAPTANEPAPPPAPPAQPPQPALVETTTAAPAPAEAAPITREQRHRMIASLAYGCAERAGFAVDPLQSWLAAERAIDAELARRSSAVA